MDKTHFMFSLVDEYITGNTSMRDFTASKGIKLSTFTYWVRKRKRSDTGLSKGGFIPLDVIASTPGSGPIEIIYPNGVRIMAQHADIQKVAQLIKIY